jgi:hypothetical protein
MSIDPIKELAPTVHIGEAAVVRLRELGLDVEVLQESLIRGDVAARQATEYHPVTAAGSMRWFDTVEALRRQLVGLGWENSDPRCSPRITNPEKTTTILATGGNSQTGLDEGRGPQFARARGNATARAVQINGQMQLNLDAVLADMASEKEPISPTWFLMYFRSRPTNELRGELSKPVRINDRGFVEQWSERIILPEITFNATMRPTLDAEDDDDVTFGVEAR